MPRTSRGFELRAVLNWTHQYHRAMGQLPEEQSASTSEKQKPINESGMLLPWGRVVDVD